MSKRISTCAEKVQKSLYKAADELEKYFDTYCQGDERRADHSVLTLRASLLEYADYLTKRYHLDISF